MKLTVEEEFDEDSGYHEYKLSLYSHDNKLVTDLKFRSDPSSPEDNNMNRSFTDVFKIPELLDKVCALSLAEIALFGECKVEVKHIEPC